HTYPPLSLHYALPIYTNPDKRFLCEIILISKNLSNQNSAEVHCHFEQYDKSLLPGMFMNAEIELSGDEVSALPSEAIVRFENNQDRKSTRLNSSHVKI